MTLSKHPNPNVATLIDIMTTGSFQQWMAARPYDRIIYSGKPRYEFKGHGSRRTKKGVR